MVGEEQVVGDRGDLLGFAPRLLQLRQFAFERAPFLLFVQRHLQREARGFGHLADPSGPGQPDLPPAPGRREFARSGSGPALGGIGDVARRGAAAIDQGKEGVDASPGIVALERVRVFP